MLRKKFDRYGHDVFSTTELCSLPQSTLAFEGQDAQ
jgi:hypothetical protein